MVAECGIGTSRKSVSYWSGALAVISYDVVVVVLLAVVSSCFFCPFLAPVLVLGFGSHYFGDGCNFLSVPMARSL